MIVSALLTSVGINLVLSVLLFVFYSLLRKQPGNAKIYAPRLLAEGRRPGDRSLLDVDRLVPSPGWVWRLWQASEDDLLASSGLDAVVFMRIFVFSLKVFSVAGVVGIFILLPVNYWGERFQDIDFSDLPNKSVDLFSISNVKDGSNRLWIHFSAAYLISGVVCYLLYIEYEHISSKRLAYFNASKPLPHHFTILVRGIPSHDGTSISDIIDSFFMEYHPSTYLSHAVVHRTSKLRGLVREGESLCKRLACLESNRHTSPNIRHGGFLGFFGQNADMEGHYSKKLEDLEDNMRIRQSDGSLKEVPAAFVCFKSQYGAATALNIQQSINPTQWVTEQAPDPHDVYWPFFSASFLQRWLSRMVVILASFVMTVLFLLPVSFVQGLTNLEQLETLFPFVKRILTVTIVSQVITGYLPSLILYTFLSIVPPIMKLFSTMQGYVSQSEIEKSACSKMLWFTIWNIFFANVLAGSITSQLNIFLDPKDIPSRLAVFVPAQASFFIAYVVTSWTSLSSELTRIFPLIGHFLGRHCFSCMDDELRVPSIPYDSEIPRILLFGLLGLTYFLLAPLILPFIMVFFCIGYVIYRNQLLNVYLPKYETGGRFWPIVHNSTVFSLILMQVVAIGIFGLKKLPLASSLIVPLPVLTFLFHDYCTKRFLPIFHAYPAETLIKKDRQYQNDPSMEGFFRGLVNAYSDPALMPFRHSLHRNEGKAPLLSSNQV